MSCEKYQKELIEVAVTGGEPEGAVTEHLARCSQCRAIWRREHAMFTAIDGALRGRMSEHPSESFLPRIRERIAHEPESEAGWNPIWAYAGSALALVLLAIAHPWTVVEQHPVERSLIGVPVHLAQRSARQNSKAGRLVRGSTEILERRGNVSRHSAERSMTKQSSPRELEVLVPPDEAKAFAQFVARLAIRDELAEAVVSPAKDITTSGNHGLPEIRSFDVADLQEPLKWKEWDEGWDAE